MHINHYFINNDNLKSELREIRWTLNDIQFTFFSDLGIFSKDKVDFASELLVKTVLKENKPFAKILDIGCGYGFIGITLSKRLNSSVDLIDINERCVHLASKNIKENKVDGKAYISDVYKSVKARYNLITTNPPIRAGKETVLNFLLNAKDYLEKNGELWFVINKNQGVKSILKAIEKTYNFEVKAKSKGFWIIRTILR